MRHQLIYFILALSACKTNNNAAALREAAPDAPPVAVAEACGRASAVGELCLAELKTLHPTQFAVGMKEVEQKAKKYRDLATPEAKAQSLAADPGMAAIGPAGEIYLVDHHHLFKALISENVTHAPVKIVENVADMSIDDFWRHMDGKGLVFPFDENGNGPLPTSQFPLTLASLKDDPYRTLAGLVTARGGFTKVTVPFLEFRWARYFRPRVAIESGDAGMEKAVQAALAISHAPEAKDLPGFIAPAP